MRCQPPLPAWAKRWGHRRGWSPRTCSVGLQLTNVISSMRWYVCKTTKQINVHLMLVSLQHTYLRLKSIDMYIYKLQWPFSIVLLILDPYSYNLFIDHFFHYLVDLRIIPILSTTTRDRFIDNGTLQESANMACWTPSQFVQRFSQLETSIHRWFSHIFPCFPFVFPYVWWISQACWLSLGSLGPSGTSHVQDSSIPRPLQDPNSFGSPA